MNKYSLSLLILGCLVATARCGTTVENPQAPASQEGCIHNFDPAKDYFPSKARLLDSRNFSVDYHGSYKLVTVRGSASGAPDEDAQTYVLLQCGAPNPHLEGTFASAPVVSIPISSLFADSPTHQQALVELGRPDVLTGIASHTHATDPQIVKRIEAGAITEFAPNGTNDTERIISAAPSIFMVSRNNDPAFVPLRAAGVIVTVNADWLEASALGRAEWIKYISLFLNEEAIAEERYAAVRNSYRAWSERVAKIPKSRRPRVTTGGIFRGNYIITGGKSYVARLISDAGGEYIWSDNEAKSSLFIDIESGIRHAADAEIWINGGPWTSLQAMLADDARYSEFKAFRNGQVWLYNRRENEGRNDYWSRGTSRPDLILADLIKIFHPELARDHEFEWYRQVPQRTE